MLNKIGKRFVYHFLFDKNCFSNREIGKRFLIWFFEDFLLKNQQNL